MRWRRGLRAVAAVLLAACSTEPALPPATLQVFEAPPPSPAEGYCAWFGDARDGVLYFGQAAFWSTLRGAGGDPRADLAAPGPQPIGRFDLRRRDALPPLSVAASGARSGVWDVLAHPNGRVYFTTFFEDMGYVEPASRRSRRFAGLPEGLNEIALGPEGTLLVTRYGGGGREPGAVLQIDPEGTLLTEHRLAPVEGLSPAAKSVAWDPVRQQIWVNTDLFDAGGRPRGHDTRVLDPDGRERSRIAEPEIQFMAFGADGAGYWLRREGTELWLRWRPRRGPVVRVLLDPHFPAGLDFAQDLKLAPNGSAVITRWSGVVHVLSSAGELRSLQLPRFEPGGLYYTGVLSEGRVCATYCGGVRVVCKGVG